MSPSSSMRKSGTLYFRHATRSTPTPKAKPEYSSGSMPDMLQNVRVDHAAAQNLKPAGALAHTAALAVVRMARAAAYAAAYVGFSGRLGEREEMRTEARLAIGAEHLLAEVFERALQIAER